MPEDKLSGVAKSIIAIISPGVDVEDLNLPSFERDAIQKQIRNHVGQFAMGESAAKIEAMIPFPGVGQKVAARFDRWHRYFLFITKQGGQVTNPTPEQVKQHADEFFEGNLKELGIAMSYLPHWVEHRNLSTMVQNLEARQKRSTSGCLTVLLLGLPCLFR